MMVNCNTYINIDAGKDVTINELAQLIKKTIGFSGEIHFDTSKPDGTMKKLTNPSKLHQLGWKHSIELEQGIELMYAYYLR